MINDKNMLLPDTNAILCFRYITILIVVSFYWIVSISTVFVNKTLLNSDVVKLNAPLFVTWTQCVTSVAICMFLHFGNKTFPESVSFPTARPFDRETVRNILPLSFLFVAMIGFNNLSLSLVGVSFYFVSRSLTTIFNVIFTWFILKQKTSTKCIVACVVIVVGFSLGINEEHDIGTLSVKGVFFGVLSSIALSLYSIQTKKSLPVVDNHVILLTLYNNLYSSVIFIPLIYLNQEFDNLKNFNFSDGSFWLLTIIGGILGFLIGFASTLQIHVTSPLTHNISGTAKSCAQTVLATYWYDETKSYLWWISNIMVLLGSAAYARIKQFEMRKSHSLTRV